MKAMPVLWIFVLFLCAPAGAQDFGPVDREWSLGPFTVQMSELPGEEDGFGGGMFNLRVLHADEVAVFLEQYPEMGFEVSGVRTGEPRPGCSSLWVTLYTGGAHCCFEDLALFTCPEGDLLARLSLGDSGSGDVMTKGRFAVLPVVDWGLAYYAPPGNTDLFLPFAFSPAMARFLIIEEQGLRPDRVGEFPGFHAGELAAARKEEVDQDFPGTCLKAAYHAYMVAGDGESALSALMERLPQAWMPYVHGMLEDIVAVAREFNPVENHFYPAQ